MTGTAASRKQECTSARKFYHGHKPYYGEKYCNKRFLDRVINLIPDSGSKALWSLIPLFLALSPLLWALIPVIFWALSPEPIYHVTTLIHGTYLYRSTIIFSLGVKVTVKRGFRCFIFLICYNLCSSVGKDSLAREKQKTVWSKDLLIHILLFHLLRGFSNQFRVARSMVSANQR